MSKFIEDFKREAESREGANVFFVAEYHKGQINEAAFVKTNPCQDVYSVAKTYIVSAVGLLWDRGLLSLDETLSDILRDEMPPEADAVWSKTTVDMLLLHRVGLPPNFLDIDCFDANLFGEDYLSYIVTAPIRADFDMRSSTYTDAAFYLLSRIVEKRAGMGADDFLWKHLFFPTGCREAAWSHCPRGHVIGATGLYIRAQDLVKHGLIYMNGGTYGGERILSREWVDTVLTRGYEFKSKNGGLAYGKGGMRGQMLLVVPAAERVVAWLGCGDNSFSDFVIEYRY
jgi:CubicO group peptidase (beta-lactamase class C family)